MSMIWHVQHAPKDVSVVLLINYVLSVLMTIKKIKREDCVYIRGDYLPGLLSYSLYWVSPLLSLSQVYTYHILRHCCTQNAQGAKEITIANWFWLRIEIESHYRMNHIYAFNYYIILLSQYFYLYLFYIILSYAYLSFSYIIYTNLKNISQNGCTLHLLFPTYLTTHLKSCQICIHTQNCYCFSNYYINHEFCHYQIYTRGISWVNYGSTFILILQTIKLSNVIILHIYINVFLYYLSGLCNDYVTYNTIHSVQREVKVENQS